MQSIHYKNILEQEIWLCIVFIFISFTIVVGGITRLTDSGLSITEWNPIIGIIPPLNLNDWKIAFEKYKLIPEYSINYSVMTLADFKYIFWWEYTHRFLGRFIGVFFLIPFIYFWINKKIIKGYILKYLFLGVLGCIQGFVGWYMVRSGLEDQIYISQYRLAIHLGLAIFLLILSFWYILELGYLRRYNIENKVKNKYKYRFFVWFLFIVVFVQMILGSVVAGINAGKIYNTWPLMNGVFIPDNLYSLIPIQLNIFEDVTTVQFNHRIVAYFILFLVIIQSIIIFYDKYHNKIILKSLILIIIILLFQIILGIITLLTFVNLYIALSHQIVAIFLLIAVINHIFKITYKF